MLFNHRIEFGHHFFMGNQIATISGVDPHLDERPKIIITLRDAANRFRREFGACYPARLRKTIDYCEGLGI
jgi:hypothetical protein